MTDPAPAEGDDGPDPRPIAPIPLPPDPMAPWLVTPAVQSRTEDDADVTPGETT